MVSDSIFNAKRIRGVGSGCVYVYYYENDKALADAKGVDRWECKIGYTRKTTSTRLLQQGISASIARTPIVALEMRTNLPHILETRVHRALYKLKITDSVGNEWYNTNPSEVEAVYEQLIPSIESLEEVISELVNVSAAFQIDSPESFGNVLRKIRLDQGMTQIDAAAKVGFRQATISKIESGSPGTRIDTILELMRSYGCSLIVARENET